MLPNLITTHKKKSVLEQDRRKVPCVRLSQVCQSEIIFLQFWEFSNNLSPSSMNAKSLILFGMMETNAPNCKVNNIVNIMNNVWDVDNKSDHACLSIFYDLLLLHCSFFFFFFVILPGIQIIAYHPIGKMFLGRAISPGQKEWQPIYIWVWIWEFIFAFGCNLLWLTNQMDPVE
jgi:hypothetical protein